MITVRHLILINPQSMSALPDFFLLFLALPILSLALAPGQIKNLVTFGDSYTDVVSVSDGGTPWPIYTAQYANLTLYPYARSGATCSKQHHLSARPLRIRKPVTVVFCREGQRFHRIGPQRDVVYTMDRDK